MMKIIIITVYVFFCFFYAVHFAFFFKHEKSMMMMMMMMMMITTAHLSIMLHVIYLFMKTMHTQNTLILRFLITLPRTPGRWNQLVPIPANQ